MLSSQRSLLPSFRVCLSLCFALCGKSQALALLAMSILVRSWHTGGPFQPITERPRALCAPRPPTS